MLDPVADAAANNAAWCDAVCRAHGLPTAWSASAWTVGRRSPEGYPDAVTLSTSARPAGVLNGIHTGSGCSIKDSFAGLDLAPQGFRVLFEAPWIHRPAGDPNLTPILDWHEVRTPA